MNQIVSAGVSRVIIGLNKGWKQDINIGKKNNQNFVSIGHSKYLQMLEYKLRLEGIELVRTEESYTSKTSFLDGEYPAKRQVYAGKRKRRGLFKSGSGVLINADLNGAYQIIKKVIPDAYVEGIEGLPVNPRLLSISL